MLINFFSMGMRLLHRFCKHQKYKPIRVQILILSSTYKNIQTGLSTHLLIFLYLSDPKGIYISKLKNIYISYLAW